MTSRSDRAMRSIIRQLAAEGNDHMKRCWRARRMAAWHHQTYTLEWHEMTKWRLSVRDSRRFHRLYIDEGKR